MIRYRVYSNYKGWNNIGNKGSIEEAIATIEGHIQQEKAEYIIVEQHKDMDIPLKSIASIEKLNEFKQEQKTNIKALKKTLF